MVCAVRDVGRFASSFPELPPLTGAELVLDESAAPFSGQIDVHLPPAKAAWRAIPDIWLVVCTSIWPRHTQPRPPYDGRSPARAAGAEIRVALAPVIDLSRRRRRMNNAFAR